MRSKPSKSDRATRRSKPAPEPEPESEHELRRVVVYLPAGLSRRLSAACAADGQTVSSWARLAAEEKIRRATQSKS